MVISTSFTEVMGLGSPLGQAAAEESDKKRDAEEDVGDSVGDAVVGKVTDVVEGIERADVGIDEEGVEEDDDAESSCEDTD